MNYKTHIKNSIILVLALILIDYIFTFIYPNVNFIRATLVSLTAFVLFQIPYLQRATKLKPLQLTLPIALAAFVSVALISTGILISRTTISAIFHVLLLIVVYLLVVKFKK